MTRKQANRAILLELYNLIEKYSDLRFGQILLNAEIITYRNDYDEIVVEDPFYKESEDTLNRMMKSRIISKEYN